MNRNASRQGFTLIEVVIAVAIVAILAAAISPMVFHHLEDAKVGKAQNETETIALAVMSYYKDTGTWPYTNQDGPAGNGIERVISSPVVAAGAGPAAGANAVRWGNYGDTKMLGDYLYYNNPDGDSDADRRQREPGRPGLADHRPECLARSLPGQLPGERSLGPRLRDQHLLRPRRRLQRHGAAQGVRAQRRPQRPLGDTLQQRRHRGRSR